MGCGCTKDNVLINGNKYYIISKIADGGFGSVDLVREAKADRKFALKRVRCNDRHELERISHENRYYKQLNGHSNISK
jgi:serine/threonine protein kinase